MIGTTSSGTLIVLLGTYVSYIHMDECRERVEPEVGSKLRSESTSRVDDRCACQSIHEPPTMTTSAVAPSMRSSVASSPKSNSEVTSMCSSPSANTGP